MDGKQGGDPAKLTAALVQLAALENRPARFAAGADAVELFETKPHTLLAQADAPRAVLQPRARRRLTLAPTFARVRLQRRDDRNGAPTADDRAPPVRSGLLARVAETVAPARSKSLSSPSQSRQPGRETAAP
jgi:hypothetical protein